MVCGYVFLELLVDSSVDLIQFGGICWQVEGFDLCSVCLEEQGCISALVEAGVIHDEDESPVAFPLRVA